MYVRLFDRQFWRKKKSSLGQQIAFNYKQMTESQVSDQFLEEEEIVENRQARGNTH